MHPLELLLAEAESELPLQTVAALLAGGAEAICDAVAAALPPLDLQGVVASLVESDIQGCVADQERAEHCKASGNACFKGLAFSGAVQHYTEALQYTDETSPGGAALAAVLYTNRALSLRRLKQLGAALTDTAAALQCNPAHQKAIYQRECILQERGDPPPAVPPAGAGRPARASEDSAAALASRLEGGLQLGEDAALEAAAALARQAASGAVTVERREGSGRLLVAAEPLAAGVDFLQERPYAHVLSPANRRTHCGHCCSALAGEPAAYCCRRCPLAVYCSLSCRDADAFHVPGGPECGLPWPVLLPFHLVLALRLARRQLQEPNHPASGHVASLETHLGEADPEGLREEAVLAAVAAAVWREAASTGVGGSGAPVQPTAGRVLTELLRLRVNGVAMVPAARAGSEDRLGLGLYPVASCMNHACLPNVSPYFKGSTLVLRTLEALPAGQPLLHCYGPQAGAMTTEQRQHHLRQQYRFTCACLACERPAPCEAAIAGLRCPRPGCRGAVRPAAAVAAGLLSEHSLPPAPEACCSACQAPLPASDWHASILPSLEASLEAHTQARAVFSAGGSGSGRRAGAPAEGEAREAVLAMRASLEAAAPLHPGNQRLARLHADMARALHSAGELLPAVEHMRASLAAMQTAYPPDSTALAFHRQRLAALLSQAAAAGGGGGREEEEEAAALRGAAAAVLQLHFAEVPLTE